MSMTERGLHRAQWALLTVTVVCVLALVGGLAATAWWWGVGFDEAEKLGVATPATHAAMVTSLGVAVGGLVGLVVAGVVALALSRRTQT